MADPKGNLLDEAQALAPELAAWRHELHQVPELGNDTPETSAFVQARLDEMGVTYKTLVDGSCVVALIGRGAQAAAEAGTPATCTDEQAGPTILLRADMDGLPVAEESGEAFAATCGRMHACGHDMHATNLLGAARLLKAHEDELATYGTAKLVFQPGEETFSGMRAAIADGLLESPRPSVGFAMHVFGALPVGVIGYGTQNLTAVHGFRIKIQGSGGHGSSPDECVDPINVGVHIHLALQELVAREVSPLDTVALTIGRFSAGEAPNVIPDTAVLEGTLRAFDNDVFQRVVRRINEVATQVAATYRASATIEVLSDIPPLESNAELNTQVLSLLGEALPEGTQFLDAFHGMASEDYALVAQQIPSTYLMIGAGPEDPSQRFPQHHPKIRFRDEALPLGVCSYAAVALGWLADPKVPETGAGTAAAADREA